MDKFIYDKSVFPWVITPTQNGFNRTTYPKVSVVVPSYNQGEYLEETLLSVINQNYPNLELIVIDGGSTDNSIEIIKKYEPQISYWVSEKDRGQSHAINKGFEKATGEWLAWMNSDDCYKEGAFKYIFDEIDYFNYDFLFGNCYAGNTMADAVENRHPKNEKEGLKDILRFFYHVSHIIPSQSVFVRKSIVDNVGLLKEDLHYCMDLDWFSRIFIETQKRLYYDKAICFYRVNDNTKTGSSYNKMADEALQLAELYLPNLSSRDQNDLKSLMDYFKRILKYMSKNKKSVLSLLNIGLRYPKRSLSDIRFKTLVKRLIIKN